MKPKTNQRLMFVKIYSKTYAWDKSNAHFGTKNVKKEATNLKFSQSYPIKLSSDKNNTQFETKNSPIQI